MSKTSHLGQSIAVPNWWPFFVDNLNGLNNVAGNVPAQLSDTYQVLLQNGSTLYDTITSTASMDATTAASTLQEIEGEVQQWFQQTYSFAQQIGAADPTGTIASASACGSNAFNDFLQAFSADPTAAIQGLSEQISGTASAVGGAVTSLSNLGSLFSQNPALAVVFGVLGLALLMEVLG